jgi:hypothetical protein
MHNLPTTYKTMTIINDIKDIIEHRFGKVNEVCNFVEGYGASKKDIADFRCDDKEEAFCFYISQDGTITRVDFTGEVVWGKIDDGTFLNVAKAAFSGVEWVDADGTMKF